MLLGWVPQAGRPWYLSCGLQFVWPDPLMCTQSLVTPSALNIGDQSCPTLLPPSTGVEPSPLGQMLSNVQSCFPWLVQTCCESVHDCPLAAVAVGSALIIHFWLSLPWSSRMTAEWSLLPSCASRNFMLTLCWIVNVSLPKSVRHQHWLVFSCSVRVTADS